MNSPIHPQVRLRFKELEPGLQAYECPRSGGVWIPLHCYLEWKEKQRPAGVPLEIPSVAKLEDDSRHPIRLCPESGRFLLRYRVGHGLLFRVDQSPATGGVWLDKGEWEALKSKCLHTQLNMIFTASYQHDVRQADYGQTVEKIFREKIGADFDRVAEFKCWLSTHPQSENILRYIMHDASAIGTPMR